MFHRNAIGDLAEWKLREGRMPLVIRGARQTGKSVLVRLFARDHFESLVELNFEAEPALASLFESNDPSTIVTHLELYARKPIREGRTLLFLDEVQAAPNTLATLRYFHERMPGMHVVAAGSLLDFAFEDPVFSTPVGRIEYLHLGPVQFEEFLGATGEGRLRKFLAGWHRGDPFPDAVHSRLMNLLRVFLVVGGMPASVASFVESGRLHDSDRIRHSILATFRDDFAKYERRVNVPRVRKVFDALPGTIGSRFKYSRVDREERSKDLGTALDLLCKARIAHRVRHTAGNGVPLAAEADDSRFKVLFLDVGLILASHGVGLLDLNRSAELTVVNAGAVAEQFVGQHLLHSDRPYKAPDLFFWARESRNSSAEVDYMLAEGGEVIPVEVKAGKTGTLKSMHAFLDEKSRSFAVRFNSLPPSLLDVETSLPSRPRRPFRLLSLPLYMVGQTRRLCGEVAGE